MSWRLLDTFLLRRAGFSFDLLDRFAAPELAEQAMDWARTQARAEQARAVLLSRLFPAAVQRARVRDDAAALRTLSKLRRQVGARRVGTLHRNGQGAQRAAEAIDADLAAAHGRWIDLTAQADRLAEKIEAQLEPVRQHASRELRALAQRPDITDALLQLSPDFHQAVLRYRTGNREGAAARAHDRRLYAYLQRLAAKNETTSFFGPVTFGRFGALDAPAFGPEEPGGVRERRAFVSFWAAAAIGKAATRRAWVRALVPARRLPVVRITAGHAVLPGRPKIPLSTAQRLVLAACDGNRPPEALAEATTLDHRTVAEALLFLERNGLIQRRCEPCSTSFDPLGDVLSQLSDAASGLGDAASGLGDAASQPSGATRLGGDTASGLSDAASQPSGAARLGGDTASGPPEVSTLAGFLVAARRFERLVGRFARAPRPERPAALAAAEQAFTDLTGAPARRNAGGTYADRLVLFEDCLGDNDPLVLPHAWRRRIERDLAVVLDLGLAVGQAVRDAYRALAVTVLRDRPAVSFLDFAERLAAAIADGGLADRLDRARRIHDNYRDLVLATGDGPTAVLTAEQLRALARPTPGQAFVSPDVMLTGAGPGPLVLGEIHPYVFGWGLQGGFAPDPAALRTELAQLPPVWGGERRLATVLHRRRHKGLVSNWFPGTFLEVTGSAHTAWRRAGVGDLKVVLDGGQPTLVGPDGPLELYVGEQDHPHLRVFAPAQVEVPRLALGEHTPRIVVGDVVVQRRRWELSQAHRAELVTADAARLPLVVAALRHRLDLPRHLFASSPAETKPRYVDLDALFGQQALRQFAELGPVTVVEMLPDPDQLWLRRGAGRFTSELRLSMVRSAGDPGGDNR